MTRLDLEHELRQLAGVQGGVVHRRQLEALGADRWWIQRRIAVGVVERRSRGVLRLVGVPIDERLRRWEATLAGGPDTVLSHRCAANLHGLGSFPRHLVEVTVAWPSHPRLPGVTVHQLGDLEATDRTSLDGLPVTTVARTCGDLAAVCSGDRLLGVIDEALDSGALRRDALARVAARLARPGKPGARRLAAATAARFDDEPPPQSELERLVETLLMDAGLPTPRRQFQTPGGRVDFAFPDVRLAIEADGRRWHQRADRMLEDRRRDRRNAAAGWTTVRCMWEDAVGDSAALTAELRSVWATTTRAAA